MTMSLTGMFGLPDLETPYSSHPPQPKRFTGALVVFEAGYPSPFQAFG